MIVEGALAMFVKIAEEKRNLSQPEASSVQAAPAAVEAPAKIPSIISVDLTIRGTLSTDRNLQIDGRIEGDIHAAGLLLCEQSLVIGNIHAQEAVVKGRVEGSIEANIVHLAATAQVTGDVIHGGQLSMEAGAYFEGTSRHRDRVAKNAEIARGASEMFAVAAE
jgi:cytoskeletal protein CcmA (bactofilin family)